MHFIYKYLMPKEFIGFALVTHYYTPALDTQELAKKTVFEWYKSMKKGKYAEGDPFQRKSSKKT